MAPACSGSRRSPRGSPPPMARPLAGSFDPAVAGCTAAMFIDAEHSGPACLRALLDLVPGL